MSENKGKHVNLKRGKSEAELNAAKKEEKEKIAPFSFEKDAKPLHKSLGLDPDGSTVELNNKNSTIAPFNYKE